MFGKARNGHATGFDADIDVILCLLDRALATELLSVSRYRQHYFMVPAGRQEKKIKRELLLHAGDQQLHADLIAARIVQLGGSPDFDPAGLTGRSNVEFGFETSLQGMLEEDLLGERAAIDSYRNMIHYMRDRDPVTSRMFEEILATSEDHAEDLARMLLGLPDAADHKQIDISPDSRKASTPPNCLLPSSRSAADAVYRNV